MIRKFIGIVFLTMTSTTALCQKPQHNSGFMQGYIVTINNDTIFGEVQFREVSGRMLGKIRYRVNRDADLVDYKPGEIKAFQLGRYSYFVLRGAYYQLISEGKIDIYERRDHTYIHQTHFISGPVSSTYSTTTRAEEEESYFLMINEAGEELEYLNDSKLIKEELKNRLSAYFAAAPELVSKISRGYYTSADILYMAYEFNEPGKYQLRLIDDKEYKKEKAAQKKRERRFWK